MSAATRLLGLPAAALVLVCAVIGVQVANGGGSFEPLRPADPCATREVASRSDGIDGLVERLVLLGVDDAACDLGVTREALTLEIGQGGTRSAAEIDALRDGLRSAVKQMKEDGSLPPASDLVDDALDQADLNGLLERLIRALPDSLVDDVLKTDDVLLRTVDDLDLQDVLANLGDTGDLNAQMEKAVTQAVKDSIEDRLRTLI